MTRAPDGEHAVAAGRSVVVVTALAVVAVVTCGGAAVYGAARSGPSAPAPPVRSAPDVFTTGVQVGRDGEPGLWLAWSLSERGTGRRVGSANAATERTNAESVIKAWIAADALRVAHEARRPLSRADRELIRRTVRSSDDDAAEAIYRRLGGDAVLRDLRRTCGVDVATTDRGYWALAQITAVDATRILDCVLRLAPSWPGGAELVGDLRTVDDDGRSGIAALLPGAPVAEKNGWTLHSGAGWNVNCVVAWGDYALAVLTRYPDDRSEHYGWGVCRDVARDVLSAMTDP